ncbi:four-carbon acid sugar kinase family protein [Zobellia nedashkovskayae]
MSRGDSTLRGHYPNEVDALEKGMGLKKNKAHISSRLF